jgi:hypothetical protein
MMTRILTGWTIPRAFYLLIGSIIFIQSIVQAEWLGIAFGGYFAAMGLFGFGCAAGNCYPVSRKIEEPETRALDYEDVKKQ